MPTLVGACVLSVPPLAAAGAALRSIVAPQPSSTASASRSDRRRRIGPPRELPHLTEIPHPSPLSTNYYQTRRRTAPLAGRMGEVAGVRLDSLARRTAHSTAGHRAHRRHAPRASGAASPGGRECHAAQATTLKSPGT